MFVRTVPGGGDRCRVVPVGTVRWKPGQVVPYGEGWCQAVPGG
jgi:hypothetical protein